MKITQLDLNNFKGSSLQTVKVNGLDIFQGPNGSGKTRILQAVQLLISGAVPHAIDPTNIDLTELFTKQYGVSEMEIRAVFDEGNLFDLTRSYEIKTKDGADSVSQMITFSPNPEKIKGPRDSEKHIKSILGDFPVMIDIHKFIRMSKEKRAELIFSFCPVNENVWTVKVIGDRLADSLNKFDKDTSRFYLAKLAFKGLGVNIQSAIDDKIQYLKEQQSTLKKECTSNSGAATASLQLNTTSGKTAMRHVQDIEKEIAGLRERETKTVESIANSNATVSAVKRLELDKAQLREEIKKTEEGLLNKEALEKEIADAKALIVPITQEEEDVLKFLKQEAEEWKATERRLKENHMKLLLKLDAEKQRIDAIRNGHCPFCGQETTALIQSADDGLHEIQTGISELEKSLQDSAKKITEFSTKISGMEQEFSKRANENIRHESSISKTNMALANLNGQSVSLKKMQERLAGLELQKIDGEAVNVGEAELQLEGIRANIVALEAELRAKREYDAKLSLAKSAALKSKQAEESLEIVKALLKELLAIRKEIVRSALEPVEKEASELFSKSGMDATFSFRFEDARGNDAFTFGWSVQGVLGDQFVDFDSLSTAQQAFTLVSLLAPLIHRGNPKLRMLIIDNCEVIDEGNRLRFISLLVTAKEKYLDNILIASSSPFPMPTAETRFALHRLNVDIEEVTA